MIRLRFVRDLCVESLYVLYGLVQPNDYMDEEGETAVPGQLPPHGVAPTKTSSGPTGGQGGILGSGFGRKSDPRGQYSSLGGADQVDHSDHGISVRVGGLDDDYKDREDEDAPGGGAVLNPMLTQSRQQQQGAGPTSGALTAAPGAKATTAAAAAPTRAPLASVTL